MDPTIACTTRGLVTMLSTSFVSRDHAARRAFTLIELLVVISIICLLVGMLFVAGRMARDAARGAVTKARIDEVLRALSAVTEGEAGGTAATIIHRQLQPQAPTVVRGISRFILDQRHGRWYPATGESWIAPPYASYEFPHPWGKVPTDLPGDAPSQPPAADAVLALESHKLSDLTPVISEHLLYVSGILENARFPTLVEAQHAYRTDRSTGAPWNDGWGRPLVIGFGQFHPRKNTALVFEEVMTDFNGIEEDLFLRRAKTSYGYWRSLYLSIGAVGPTLPDTVAASEIALESADWTTPSTGILARLWAGVHQTVNKSSATERWRTDGSFNAFITPPWTGVVSQRDNGKLMFLSAPLEIQ